ncbi:odorant receptor 22b-like [Microplitis mediator]|uniref:odorant receptor 22b-like n=1 Tax=Microplitis mediator TaxID=375433 RepID=UPI002553AF99|nr:odorant receptor 22b-like [Microplitis mediator]
MDHRCLKKVSQPSSSNSMKCDAFKYTYWYLNLIAIWPLISQSLAIRKVISVIHVFFVTVMLLWQIIFRCYHVYFYAIDLDEQVTLIGPMIFILVSLLKYLAIIAHRKTIMKSIEHIKTDWSMTKCREEKNIMIKNITVSKKITIVFSILMYTSGVFYNFMMPHVIPLIFRSNDRNYTKRLIIFPGYNSAFNVDSSPLYEITYLFHTIAIFFCFTVLVSTCNLIVVLVTHTNCRIQIVIVQLKSLIEDFFDGGKFSYLKMSNMVRHHIRVLEFSDKILRKLLSEICLVEIGATSMLLCVDEFCCLRLLSNQDFANIVPYIMLFLALSLNILILSYFSELLNSQFIEISNQCYMTDWYKIPLKARKYFILIMNMSQRPQKISAGGIIDLSYMTYVQIIKTGFAYLQILRASNTQSDD